jgi:hypothetical protein
MVDAGEEPQASGDDLGPSQAGPGKFLSPAEPLRKDEDEDHAGELSGSSDLACIQTLRAQSFRAHHSDHVAIRGSVYADGVQQVEHGGPGVGRVGPQDGVPGEPELARADAVAYREKEKRFMKSDDPNASGLLTSVVPAAALAVAAALVGVEVNRGSAWDQPPGQQPVEQGPVHGLGQLPVIGAGEAGAPSGDFTLKDCAPFYSDRLFCFDFLGRLFHFDFRGSSFNCGIRLRSNLLAYGLYGFFAALYERSALVDFTLKDGVAGGVRITTQSMISTMTLHILVVAVVLPYL